MRESPFVFLGRLDLMGGMKPSDMVQRLRKKSYRGCKGLLV